MTTKSLHHFFIHPKAHNFTRGSLLRALGLGQLVSYNSYVGPWRIWPCLFEKYPDTIRLSVKLFCWQFYSEGVCWGRWDLVSSCATTRMLGRDAYDLIFSRSIQIQFGLSIQMSKICQPLLCRCDDGSSSLGQLVRYNSYVGPWCIVTKNWRRSRAATALLFSHLEKSSAWGIYYFIFPDLFFHIGLFWCVVLHYFLYIFGAVCWKAFGSARSREWCKTPLMSRCQVPSPGGRIQREGLMQ